MRLVLRRNFRARVKRGRYMIVCVCGMIGAGKTTWCKEQAGVVSDFDDIGDKRIQLQFTLKKHEAGEKVYHITCFPTREEREAFDKENVKYVWINTSFVQCRKNIFSRNRSRDIENIESVLNANENIMEKYFYSDLKFEVVDVFESEEKW